MKRTIIYIHLCLLILLLFQMPAFSQVLINNGSGTPDPSSMLEIRSTDKGLLLPRIDFNNRPANPAPGLIIFVTANGPYGNNAIYLYTGAAWTKLNTTTNLPGDYFGGGVVFYVDGTGQHGLIAALSDQAISMDWGCDTVLIGPAAEHWDFGFGQVNTSALLPTACREMKKRE